MSPKVALQAPSFSPSGGCPKFRRLAASRLCVESGHLGFPPERRRYLMNLLKLTASQRLLGSQQRRLGSQQWPLGTQQWPLGTQQWPLGTQQWPLGTQQWPLELSNARSE